MSFAGVAIVTFVANRLIPVNTTTVGFANLLLVLVIASAWGFVEAALASVLATLLFNFFFFPPAGKFTIADPQNWVALFSFLATSLMASRLSTMAKRRALEAMERQRDLEHLYAFSRAMLLIDRAAPFPQQLLDKLAEIFDFVPRYCSSTMRACSIERGRQILVLRTWTGSFAGQPFMGCRPPTRNGKQ